jgi:outer membrane protein assembly factor BamE (lipoprotein component of BamABCDE complex)
MVLLFLISFLGGCATTIKYGSLPRIDKLETLKVGGSNKTDVRQSLGEPRGYGAARFSSVPKLSEIWFYEFYVSQGSKTSLTLLLVFFDEDLYEGHLWFSGTQLIDTSE